jgi:hypothetical protein
MSKPFTPTIERDEFWQLLPGSDRAYHERWSHNRLTRRDVDVVRRLGTIQLAHWDGSPTASDLTAVEAMPEYREWLAQQTMTDNEYAARNEREAREHAERKAAIRADAIASGQPGYYRVGQVPACGFSINYRDNVPEPGVSAFEGWLMPNGDLVIDSSAIDIVSGLFIVADDKPWFRLTGDVVGRGADGEPCLRVVTANRIKVDTVQFA